MSSEMKLQSQRGNALTHQNNMTQPDAWNHWPQGQAPVSSLGLPLHPGPPTWMFAGRPCTVREFADRIWPEPTAEKTAFLLRWDGFER